MSIDLRDSPRPLAWFTYAWKDNAGINQGDVDYIIQEIEQAGVELRYDRRSLVVGRRLWEQIEDNITDPSKCDAWIYLATPASLSSQRCREELSYALHRTLQARDAAFPLIGLVHGPIPDLPGAISTRLWVSTDSSDWAAAVARGVRGEASGHKPGEVPPYAFCLDPWLTDEGVYVFDVHPRTGAWSPFVFGLPETEAHRLVRHIYAAPGAHNSGSVFSELPKFSKDGYEWHPIGVPPVSRTTSAHIFLKLCREPVSIFFGQAGSDLFEVPLSI